MFAVVCAWDFGFCVAGCVLITVWWCFSLVVGLVVLSVLVFGVLRFWVWDWLCVIVWVVVLKLWVCRI